MLKYQMSEKMVRKLIIRMADLAKQWKEPYDDMDREARSFDRALEEKWNIYAEMLSDLLEDDNYKDEGWNNPHPFC